MYFCELVISIIYSQLVTKLSFVPLPAGSDFTTKKTAEHLLSRLLYIFLCSVLGQYLDIASAKGTQPHAFSFDIADRHFLLRVKRNCAVSTAV